MKKLITFVFFVICCQNIFAQGNATQYDFESKEISEDMIIVSKNGLFGFVNVSENKEAIAPQYKSANVFTEGLAFVTAKNNKKYFIDKDNKKVFEIECIEAAPFKEGFSRIKRNTQEGERWGFIDKKGALVIPCVFYDVQDFLLGYAIVNDNYSGMANLINKKGEPMFSFLFDRILPTMGNRYIVVKNNYFALFDEKENQLMKPQSEPISYDDRVRALFCDNAKGVKRYFDLNGQELKVDFPLSFIGFNRERLGFVTNQGKIEIVDSNFISITPLLFDAVNYEFISNLIALKLGKEYCFYNKKLERIDSLIFDNVIYSDFFKVSKPIFVTKNGYANILDSKTFRPKFPYIYEYIDQEFDEKATNKLFLIQKNGKYGYINAQKKVVVEPIYDGFGDNIVVLKGKGQKIVMKIKNKSGIIDLDTKSTIIPYVYDNLGNIDHNENIIFDDFYQSGLINIKNDTIIQLEYEKIRLENTNNYLLRSNNSYCIANKNGKIISKLYDNINLQGKGYIIKKNRLLGFLGIKGNEIITPIFKDGFNIPKSTKNSVQLPNGRINPDNCSNLFMFYNDVYNANIVNENGITIIPQGYTVDINSVNDDDLIRIYKDKMTGLIDTTGKIIFPCIYESLIAFGQGYIAQKGSQFGILDVKHNIIQPFSACYIRLHKNGKYCDVFQEDETQNGDKTIDKKEVTIPKRQDLIGEDLKLVSNFAYERIVESGNYFLAKLPNGNFGILDKDLKTIVPFEYNIIKFLRNNFAVKKNNKFGLIDINQKVIIPFEYDDIYEVGECMVVVQNNKSGIWKDGKLIIPCQYDRLSSFNDYKRNIYQVSKNNKWGIIDDKDRVIIPLEYEPDFKIIGFNYLKVKKGLDYGLYDLNGKLIHDTLYQDFSIKNGEIIVEERLLYSPKVKDH